jgi:pimeloyl-ACP methyl ester carboxylesterase
MTFLAVIVTFLAAGVLYQSISLRRHRRRYPPPGHLVDVGGHRLHVHCQGSGRPLVLLESGIAASSLSWAMVQPEIAKFTRVCAYDRAGLAWSDAAPGHRSFERILTELSGVLAAVAPNEQCVLVGHSFGSFIVRAYAARHPSTTAGLVLVDPPTEWLETTDERGRLLRGGAQLSMFGALLARIGVVRACLGLLTGGAPGAPRHFVRIFGPTTARTLERLVGEVRKLPPAVHPVVQGLWCQPKCFSAMAEYLRVLEREGASLAAMVPPREIPVIVVSSEDQPAEHVAAHRALAELSAHGRHVTATHSTHWVQFDDPAMVVGLVRDLVFGRVDKVRVTAPAPAQAEQASTKYHRGLSRHEEDPGAKRT